MVLLIGSYPKIAFCVIGFSFKFKIVAPAINLSENLCSTFTPKKRLDCRLKAELFSTETCIGVSELAKLGLIILTLPI